MCYKCGAEGDDDHWPSQCPISDEEWAKQNPQGGDDGTPEETADTYRRMEQMSKLPKCPDCVGEGWVTCVDCNGVGERYVERRATINGRKSIVGRMENCPTCCDPGNQYGRGRQMCNRCDGMGRLGAKEIVDPSR